MEDTLVDSFILNHIRIPKFNIIYYILWHIFHTLLNPLDSILYVCLLYMYIMYIHIYTLVSDVCWKLQQFCTAFRFQV